jgi:hypothetical protein
MMKAPALNPQALAAAMMLLVVAGATDVMAAPLARAPAPPMRTLMRYADGAWLARTAVVLKSAKDWNDWNDDMVAQGKAVGREAMPAVDWAREAVLVVTMGEGGASLELKNARRVGLADRGRAGAELGRGRRRSLPRGGDEQEPGQTPAPGQRRRPPGCPPRCPPTRAVRSWPRRTPRRARPWP